MTTNGSTTFWSGVGIIATAVGSLFFLFVSHAGEPKHPGAARESDVTTMAVRVARVTVEVNNNKEVLQEVKEDVQALRVQQNRDTEEILRAIRAR